MLFSLLALVSLAIACADNELHARDGSAHAHAHEKREYPQAPLHTTDTPVTLSPPYRPLIWGDFNVIQTTDTHGWLLGHQKLPWPEPNYSGDLGDFASFVTRMKQIAIEKDVDLLLVDSGDLHDGTGLSDGFPPGGVDGHDSNKFLLEVPYDLMTIGNHELGIYADTYDMYTNFVPHMNGRYLTSNVNITVFNSNGEVESVPVGNRNVTFTTRKGRKVTSLGVLFDFKSTHNTTVQHVAEMVKEQWFADAIADEPDVFVLVGHMPVSCDNWPIVFNAIRAVHAYTPILIFGGHTHIRDCQQYDGRSMALESGCYMETIGWMSANLDAAKGNTNDITFTRRYMDQNRVTYQYHTSILNTTYDTDYGRNITAGLKQLAVDFNLSYVYGTAPRTYTWDQSPYPSNGSVLTLFIAEAAPVALAINNPRANIPNIIITNAMMLRYDVFKGPFTKNDQLTAAPYADAFVYIPNVKASIAKKVLPTLNGDTPSKRSLADKELWDHGRVEGRSTSDLTPGYVTMDGCPGPGDDTLHAPIPHYYTPEYIGSNPPSVPDNATIDLVFLEFIESTVLKILNRLQTSVNYTSADVKSYTNTTTNVVLELYAQKAWN